MDQNLFVIIPTYNRKDFVVQAIDSCVSQNLPSGWSIKALVVDDGSSDNTTQHLAQKYALTANSDHVYSSSKVTVVKIPNSERGAARNRGAALATKASRPHWFLFLDADDILAPGSLQKILPQIKEGSGVVSAKYLLWDGKQTSGRPQPPSPREGRNVTDEFLRANPLALGTTFIRSDVFLKTAGFSENRELSGSEDWVFLFQISALARVQFIKDTLVWYRRHGQNTPPMQTEKAIRLSGIEIENFLKSHYQNRFTESQQKLAHYHSLILIGAYNSEGDHKKALSLCLKNLKSNPANILNCATLRTYASVVTKLFV